MYISTSSLANALRTQHERNSRRNKEEKNIANFAPTKQKVKHNLMWTDKPHTYTHLKSARNIITFGDLTFLAECVSECVYRKCHGPDDVYQLVMEISRACGKSYTWPQMIVYLWQSKRERESEVSANFRQNTFYKILNTSTRISTMWVATIHFVCSISHLHTQFSLCVSHVNRK